MTDEEWKEYQSNTQVMFSALESCLQQLLRAGRNVSISRIGDSDTGRKVLVDITNKIDLEVYTECINFRKDVFDFFKLKRKYYWSNNGNIVREVFILDAGHGLIEYEFTYASFLL